MKKLVLVFLIFAAVYSAQAQKRFELDVTTKLGYYFPVNEKGVPDDYFPENAFSPAVGISFGYTFFKSTGVFVGMEYSHLSPKMNDYFGNDLDVTWQSFNVPFFIEQGIGDKFFLTGGVTLIQQLKGYYKGFGYNSPIKTQELPEYNWQIGAGYKLKDLRISLQYYRGFKAIEKYTNTPTGENSWFGANVIHQEVFVKLEYPLWKF
jgi:hypothetical protein